MKLRTLGPNATAEDVLAELDQAGAVVVKDVIGEETLERFNSEVMPYVERTPMGRDDFVGKATKRTGALADLPGFDIARAGPRRCRGVPHPFYEKNPFAPNTNY